MKYNQIFKEILEIVPDAKLQIVGDGEDRSELEELVISSNLKSKVEFLGRRDDVPEILEASRILWQLSESEAMPMVILEAMATGLPVIGFDVRGIRDAVSNNETGYLVNYGSVDKIAQASISLLQDSASYMSLSIMARKRAEKFFDLNSMIDGHEHALLDIIKNK